MERLAVVDARGGATGPVPAGPCWIGGKRLNAEDAEMRGEGSRLAAIMQLCKPDPVTNADDGGRSLHQKHEKHLWRKRSRRDDFANVAVSHVVDEPRNDNVSGHFGRAA